MPCPLLLIENRYQSETNEPVKLTVHYLRLWSAYNEETTEWARQKIDTQQQYMINLCGLFRVRIEFDH